MPKSLLACVLALFAGCSQQSAISVAEPTYRQVRRLEAATAVGVSKATYDEMLQDVAAEVRVLSDLAADSLELLSVFYYQDALRAYSDAGAVWAAQIDNPSFVPRGRIYWTDLDLARKYGLSIDSLRTEYSRTWYSVVASESIQRIWTLAAARADSGHRVLVPRLRELRR